MSDAKRTALARKFVAKFLATAYARGRCHERDLIQEATIAAWEAELSYDATKGASLETWAFHAMRSACNRYLNKFMSVVPHKTERGDRGVDVAPSTFDAPPEEPSHDPTDLIHDAIASIQSEKRIREITTRIQHAAGTLRSRSDASNTHEERVMKVWEVFTGQKTEADVARELGVSREYARKMTERYTPLIQNAVANVA